MTEITSIHTVATRLRRMARPPYANAAVAPAQTVVSPSAKPKTKSDRVLELLTRPEGATLVQLVEATGWLSHTTRAALTGLKKKGHALTSEKADGGARIYRVTCNAVQSSGVGDHVVIAENAA